MAEASPDDRIWGIGMDQNEAAGTDSSQWRGRNLLGFALMEVRDEIRRLRRYEDEVDFGDAE